MDEEQVERLNYLKWRPFREAEAVNVILSHFAREVLGKTTRFPELSESKQHGWIDARVLQEAVVSSLSGEEMVCLEGNIFHFTPETLDRLRGAGREILALTGLCFYTSEVCHWIISDENAVLLAYSELDEDRWRKSFKQSGMNSTKTSCPVTILSNENLLESIGSDASILSTEILEELELFQLQTLKYAARRIVVQNLCNFTYSFPKNFHRSRPEMSRWLQQVLGQFTHDDGQVTHDERVKGLNTIKDVSAEPSVVSRSENLLLYLEEGAFDRFVEEYVKLVELEEVKSAEGKDSLPIFLFDFNGRSPIVGVKIEDVPEGLLSDIPVLDPSKLDPVYLHTKLPGEDYLGLFYKRITTAFVRIKTYNLPNEMGLLHLARWDRDCGVEDLDEEFLKTFLSRRAPHHERRILQIAGVPCRQALEDAVSKKVKSLRPQLSPKDRDRALALVVKSYMDFSKVVRNSSLDDLLEVLEREDEKGISTTDVLPGMFLLSAIAEKKVHTPHEPLQQRIDNMTNTFTEKGHYLASELCRILLNAWGKTEPEGDARKDVIVPFLKAFWAELKECFPDDSSEHWSFIKQGDFNHRSDDEATMTRYTTFILSTIFDRPHTSFYETAQPLPYEILDWAMTSVTRLHLLSAILPMCCGDWACSRRYDHPASRKLAWKHRNFAVSLKEVDSSKKATTHTGGKIPETPSGQSGSAWCANNKCQHACDSAPLLSVCAKSISDPDRLHLYKTVGKMGWWMNGVLNIEMHKHFRCSTCGGFMVPDLKKPPYNYFNCGKRNGDHDKGVYLSWCIGSHCSNVIDSRNGDKRCSKNKIICKKCGLCCFEHTSMLTNLKVKPLFVCRSCSRVIPEPKGFEDLCTREGFPVACEGCKTENVLFPLDTAAKKLGSVENAAIQGPFLSGGTKINTHTIRRD